MKKDIVNIDRQTHAFDVSIKSPLMIGAAIGNCVHIAGIANFLRIAESMGVRTLLLGAAISPEQLIQAVDRFNPKALGISYRLTPEIGTEILNDLFKQLGERKPILLFGGTPRMAEIAKGTGSFDFVFTGDEPFSQIEKAINLIKGISAESNAGLFDAGMKKNRSVIYRLQHLAKINGDGHCIPMLRHHFGLPAVKDTVEGIRRIAGSEVLDIISIAPDQNAQQFFFRPDQIDSRLDGAGGVAIRTRKDLKEIRKAAACGNSPLLRIYSGTQDLLEWAKISVKDLDNAWGAVPIFWFSELDGRSNRRLEDAISENQSVIKWYARQSLPVEVLEAHQWSLRDSSDAVSAAAAFIGAYNARALGVKNFIAQYMFNTPRFTSPLFDIAKMTAILAMIESLCSESFVQWRQVRPGLSHFSNDPAIAKGQLATTLSFALGLRPHIIHVVSYTEADHAANAEEVIESCKIVIGTLRNTFTGIPDPLTDERVSKKSKEIIEEASWILGTIANLGRRLQARDPFTDPTTLSAAVRIGILDAPHLRGQPCALGRMETSPIDGGCHAIDISNGQALPEQDRLKILLCGSAAKKVLGIDPHKLISRLDFPGKLLSLNPRTIEWLK